jgi:hypothetical protein
VRLSESSLNAVSSEDGRKLDHSLGFQPLLITGS